MKKVFKLVVVMLFASFTLLAIPQRFEKIYSEKYSKNESLSLFKKQAERILSKCYQKKVIPDEFLKSNFESKNIKYVLVERFVSLLSHNTYSRSPSYLFCEDKYAEKFKKTVDNKYHIYAIEEYDIYVIPLASSELDIFSKLIQQVVKDEPMCDIRKYATEFIISESWDDLLITYFNGEKQCTAYFSGPEFSFTGREGNWQQYVNEIKSDQYLMCVWRYASLNDMFENVLLSYGDFPYPQQDSQKILKYLDEEIKKILNENSDEEKN